MYKNILVPVAFDGQHDPAEALKVAQALSDGGAKITLLHIMDEVPAYVASQLPEGYQASARTQTLERLDEKRAQLSNASAVVLVGHAGTTIVDYADEHKMDLIIIASHQPGLQDYFLGSTAARVVRHAHCSVHVIR